MGGEVVFHFFGGCDTIGLRDALHLKIDSKKASHFQKLRSAHSKGGASCSPAPCSLPRMAEV